MEYRLKKQKDFNIVFNKGKRVSSKNLIMFYFKAPTLKVGYCVSKKHGKAFMRNRIKRLLRASFRSIKNDVKGNYYIVFLPKTNDEYSYNKFLSDIKFLMNKEKLFDNEDGINSNNQIL